MGWAHVWACRATTRSSSRKIRAIATIVDARGKNDFEKAHAEGAISIPAGGLMKKPSLEGVAGLPEDKSAPIVCYCAAGGEAAGTAKALKEAGYADVTNAGSLGRVNKLRAKIQST